MTKSPTAENMTNGKSIIMETENFWSPSVIQLSFIKNLGFPKINHTFSNLIATIEVFIRRCDGLSLPLFLKYPQDKNINKERIVMVLNIIKSTTESNCRFFNLAG